MAKDPSFSFYSNDFAISTQFFSNEQVGIYLRLLMAQHQHGHLTEKQMFTICSKNDYEVLSKFKIDENGLYFQERLDLEISKRKAFIRSRSNNKSGRKKIIKKESYDNHKIHHMENENENDIYINNKDIDIDILDDKKEKEKEKESEKKSTGLEPQDIDILKETVFTEEMVKENARLSFKITEKEYRELIDKWVNWAKLNEEPKMDRSKAIRYFSNWTVKYLTANPIKGYIDEDGRRVSNPHR